MIAEIIGVGAVSEGGQDLTSNAALIARELETCGISAGPCTLADGAQQLRGAIAKALGRSDIVIIMGGLGPGPAGIAKQVVCDGLGESLSCTMQACAVSARRTSARGGRCRSRCRGWL